MHYVQAVVEDTLQEVVLRKIIATYRNDIRLIGVLGMRGDSYIREKIRGFNEASAYLPHIIITDLDRIACAPQLLADWVNFNLHPNLLFRIAEKEVEAWLLADRLEIASYLGVPDSRIPANTALLADPKLHIINLARNSKKKKVKAIVPVGTASQGPGYNTILQDFVINYWNPERASSDNESLRRAIARLNNYLR
jgi:hypothetical protein